MPEASTFRGTNITPPFNGSRAPFTGFDES
jgi:hypothetical protein